MKFVFLLLSVPFYASGFSTNLQIVGVYKSQLNQIATGHSARFIECDQFNGTHQGNSIIFKPITHSGSGKYHHRIIYTFNEDYKLKSQLQKHNNIYVRDKATLKIKLPEIKDNIPFIQQSIMVITEDKITKQVASKTIIFDVTRPVLFKKTINPIFLENECRQIYAATPSAIGILSNGTTNPSKLNIKQGIQKLWSSSSGSQWGFYFSPLAFLELGNIFNLYRNYFTNYSQQIMETVELTSGVELSPGDFLQIYEQRTRNVSAFDAYKIDSCGKSELINEEYMLQWWAIAYHAVSVNPFSKTNIPTDTIGVLPSNSCSDKFNPNFATEIATDAINETQNFIRTN